jgi:hypothetical protein
MNKRIGVLILLIICLAGIIVSSYFIYFYSKQCSDEVCFSNALVKCSRMDFIRDDGNNIIKYYILGKQNEYCRVKAQIIQVKKGTVELAILEGKDMTCLLPLGIITDSLKNINECHGSLKEEIQNIIIQRMHSQIIENIGKIREGTTQVL